MAWFSSLQIEEQVEGKTKKPGDGKKFRLG
jgi:hypothetical protein